MKEIVITGAGTGIGRDAAFELARRGHRVVATCETEEQALQLLADAAGEGVSLEAFKLDVTDPDDRDKLAGRAIDVLISNAGIGESGSLAEVPMERVRRSFEVNLFAPLELAQLVLKDMIARDAGTVIFVSSVAGRMIWPFFGPYSMTKHALSSGIAALRSELRSLGSVHVSLVEPGPYRTGFNQRLANSKYAWMEKASYFKDRIATMKRSEKRMLDLGELRSTRSVVRRIVRASESARPKLRYVSPWYVALGVRVARALGIW